MGYLIGQFWLCFLVAGALGGLIAWLWRGNAARRAVESVEELSRRELGRVEERWSATLRDAEDQYSEELAAKSTEIAAANKDITIKDTALTGLKRELADTTSKLKVAREQLDSELGNSKALEGEVVTKKAEIEDLAGGREAAERKAAGLEKDLAGAISRRDSVEKKLNRKEEELETIEQELDASTARVNELAPLTGQVEQLQGRVHELEPLVAKLDEREAHIRRVDEAHRVELGEKDSEIGSLRTRLTELEELSGQLTEKDRDLATLRDDHARVLRQKQQEIERLREKLTKLEPLTGQIEERDRSLQATERRYQSVITSKDGELERLRARIARLEARAATADEAKSAATATRPRTRAPRLSAPAEPPRRKDDLKRIKGIGPVFERLLNEMGYTTFHDISMWGPLEIKTVAKKLDAFQDRIRRDGWVSQAKRLHEAEYGSSA